MPAAIAERSVREDDGTLACRIGRCEEVETVLRTLREAGAEVEDLELAKPDLEEVFVRIMGRN